MRDGKPAQSDFKDKHPAGTSQQNLSELFTFSCVLRGEVKVLEKIKDHIIQEYVDKGLVNLTKPTYDKKEIYIVSDAEWKEYQKLKTRDNRLIGAGYYW